METGNQFLGTERIGKLMRQYAIPCIISLLVGALYNIVDQIFIANASYLGSYGNAANTVVFPLTVVALAIAVMVGDGCCAFVSMALGRKESDKAKRSVGNAVVLTVAGSVILTALYLIFANQIIAMFGGTVNEETFRHSQEYFFYITLGIPFYMFGQAMNPVIRADGNPKFAMASTLAGAVINIILDPIFIFCFKWGMMGAAVATVIGQVVTAILAVWYIVHMKTVKPSRKDFALQRNICGRMLLLGITSFFVSNQSCCGNGCNQQYASQIRCARPCFQAGTVCANPNGGSWNCYEILPDCHFNSSRYGGRLYTYYRIQYGRREKIACKGTVYQVACCRSVGGCCCTCIGRGLPSSAYRHFWCKK